MFSHIESQLTKGPGCASRVAAAGLAPWTIWIWTDGQSETWEHLRALPCWNLWPKNSWHVLIAKLANTSFSKDWKLQNQACLQRSAKAQTHLECRSLHLHSTGSWMRYRQFVLWALRTRSKNIKKDWSASELAESEKVQCSLVWYSIILNLVTVFEALSALVPTPWALEPKSFVACSLSFSSAVRAHACAWTLWWLTCKGSNVETNYTSQLQAVQMPRLGHGRSICWSLISEM